MAEKRSVGDKSALVEGVEQRRAETEAAVKDFYARTEKAKPTPTQKENDLAKVGALDLNAEKEDHGAEEERTATLRTMQARHEGQGAYLTRDSSARRPGVSEGARVTPPEPAARPTPSEPTERRR